MIEPEILLFNKFQIWCKNIYNSKTLNWSYSSSILKIKNKKKYFNENNLYNTKIKIIKYLYRDD